MVTTAGKREAKEEMRDMSGPLQGVRVLEFGGIGPGPLCGMLLADLVVTGEGSIDGSTLMGKGVGELAASCAQAVACPFNSKRGGAGKCARRGRVGVILVQKR